MTLIVTLGDPRSINVEILLPCMNKASKVPLVVIGSWHQFSEQIRQFKGSSDDFLRMHDRKEFRLPKIGEKFFWDIGVGFAKPTLQLSEEERGVIAVESLHALREVRGADRLAVLTLPVDKSICRLAGFPFPGQTEFFSDLWAGDAVMILAGPKLKVALATNHLALSDVPRKITTEVVMQKIDKLATSLRQLWHLDRIRIGVCGLNPHCGDRGMFGHEDLQMIAPAIAKAKRFGVTVTGPLPADTIFHQAIQGEFDAVLAMYHDQGLGPLKTVHFYDAINVSGGLKHLRCSPDHGPASEIYMAGKARPDSAKAAWDFCVSYLQRS